MNTLSIVVSPFGEAQSKATRAYAQSRQYNIRLLWRVMIPNTIVMLPPLQIYQACIFEYIKQVIQSNIQHPTIRLFTSPNLPQLSWVMVYYS